MNTDYNSKYLKYKQKYLELKEYESQLIKEGKLNADGSLKQTGGGGTVALYKAEWCGHCKNFSPVWEKLKKANKHIKFETYDSNQHAEVIKARNIQGFPSIHINGYQYNGDRDFDSLNKLLNNAN